MSIDPPSLFGAAPYSQDHSNPVLESWRWRSYPELKGLGLQCMVQDRAGDLWFGVDDGVMHYDGVEWTAHSEKSVLSGGAVSALCASEDGRLYASTPFGIFRRDSGGWQKVFPLVAGLPWPVNDLMEAADGCIWAATAWGALWLR